MSNSIPLDEFFGVVEDPPAPKKLKAADEPSPSKKFKIPDDEEEDDNHHLDTKRFKITEDEPPPPFKETEKEVEEEKAPAPPPEELEDGEVLDEHQTADELAREKYFQENFNRKRKVALLLAYCGAQYAGMQKNPGVDTIEKKLLEALAAIGAIQAFQIDKFLYENDNQISFQRAARTDKGVSAARQTVSCKIMAKRTFVGDVNKHLPPDIRVFGIERVTKPFDAKCNCSGRTYEYLVPSFAFADNKEAFSSSHRLLDSEIERCNELLQKYVGTHNFHNFTSGRLFSDKSSYRYIKEFKAKKPFVTRGQEFISIEITGQSFMIHQIRKMIGLVMATCRGFCADEIIQTAFGEKKMDIPKAPGLGLLLLKVYYEHYNKKHCVDGLHNPLTWAEYELEAERFKIEHIYANIINEEIKKTPCVRWLHTLPNHTYAERPMARPMNSHFRGRNGVYPSLQLQHERREIPEPK